MQFVLIILLIAAVGFVLYLRKQIKGFKTEIQRLNTIIQVLENQQEPTVKCCTPKIGRATRKKILHSKNGKEVATNHIIINFTLCSPTPFGGYIIKYRPVGDVGPYRDAPGNPYTTSPAEWDDTLDDTDVQYEGYIQSDCGDGNLGEQVPFTTESPVDPPLSNPFKLGTNSTNVCDPGITVLYWAGPGAALVPGNTMYLDSGLTTPVTGFSYISDSVGTEIFNLDSGTGVVGSTTGVGC